MPLPSRIARPATGPEDFRKLREQGCYYVDKTGLIVELLESSHEAVLIPRPRRFGKTLTLSTLQHFFQKTGGDSGFLFEGLEVSRSAEAMAHQGRYPVIFVTLKGTKAPDFPGFLGRMRSVLEELLRAHSYLHDDQALPKGLLERLDGLQRGHSDQGELEFFLRVLSEALHRHHGSPVLLLIDEYDAPIEGGYLGGFYDEVVAFMRGFLGAALKTNPHLFRGVLTGVRRVSKESLFSDLNNLYVASMLETDFNRYFGFTEAEVRELLRAAGREGDIDAVRNWYNGYEFGGQVIYNPWSVLSYANAGLLKNYWVATSADALLRELLLQGDGLRGDFETLLQGGVVTRVLDEQVALRELEPGAVWSVLFTAGYLKATRVRYEDGRPVVDLAIPNREVLAVWRVSFSGWLELNLPDASLTELQRAILQGRALDVQRLLRPMVQNAFSFHNVGPRMTPERVYQAFVLGLLVSMEPHHRVRSDRESGLGRADVLISPVRVGQPGVVLEFKRVWRDEGQSPEQALDEAHAQIAKRDYAAELRAAGAEPIHTLAVAFDGKEVWVR